MTNKQYEVKEYLSSLRFAEKMIKIKLEKIEETRELGLRVNCVLRPDKVQGGRRVNIVEETALKVVELINQLEKQVDEYRDLQKNVISLINCVTDDTQRKVLELRYIHFMKWEKIINIVNYAEQHIHRLHNKGLDFISESALYKKIRS
ncbi:MAG: DUF1492 domain-containing protein [Lachnospiraceae bacterium]|nr:DUF1492 domain-containing protein [Lachnospiraceae bacterium]